MNPALSVPSSATVHSAMIVLRLSGWKGYVGIAGSGTNPNSSMRRLAQAAASGVSVLSTDRALVTVTKLPRPW